MLGNADFNIRLCLYTKCQGQEKVMDHLMGFTQAINKALMTQAWQHCPPAKSLQISFSMNFPPSFACAGIQNHLPCLSAPVSLFIHNKDKYKE